MTARKQRECGWCGVLTAPCLDDMGYDSGYCQNCTYDHQCRSRCLGKIHHWTEAEATDHVLDLGGDAYLYECDYEGPCDYIGEWRTSKHFHVASSPISRSDRKRIAAVTP
jgi:hypothetical protein